LPQFRRIYRNSWKHHQPQNQQRATVIASSPTVSSKTSTSRLARTAVTVYVPREAV
ncbi:hypothetical protein T4B_14790, partial [Trichinella pseudospiralis]